MIGSKLSAGAISAIVLSIAILVTPTMAMAKSVSLIKVNTGDKTLDKNIQSFYKCITRTGHTGGSKSEPSKAEVDGCYTQVFGGVVSTGVVRNSVDNNNVNTNSNTNIHTNTNKHHSNHLGASASASASAGSNTKDNNIETGAVTN